MSARRLAPAVRNILGSRIGRRFVALFAVCALLPLVAFAGLAVERTTALMRGEAAAALHDAAKSAGMGIAARLARVAGDLSLARAFVDMPGRDVDALAAHAAGRCAAMWTVAGGATRPIYGEAATLGALTAAEHEHLAAGRPLARFGGGGSLAVITCLRERRPADGLLAAAVDPTWFWDADELRGAGAEVFVCDSRWRPLFGSVAAPDLAPFAFAALLESSSGTVTWRFADEPQLARYWRAFLLPQYGCDLYVVQTRPQREALAVSSQFAWWFAATAAVTLLLVLLASLVLIRRTLDPVMSLREATRRLAEGDLDARTGVRGRDELGALGAAFDGMAAQLQENVRRREQTERELIASRDAALAAVRAKETFLANVSHEFRTPLSQVLAAAEILAEQDDVDPTMKRHCAENALEGAKQLVRYVEDVMALAGGEPFALAPVDVGATVQAAVDGLPPTVRAQVRVAAPSAPALALGNTARLVDLWTRLLDNAQKFSPAGAPIDVVVAGETNHVVVAVVDRGHGIAAADLPQLFQPFQQVGRDQMTDKADGIGIGLALARQIVERHGGAIACDSAPGRGTTIRVRLPALVELPAARV